MIQAKELRIGNYYKGASRGGFERVTGKTIQQIEDGKLNALPIPLTPEILERCGFEKHQNSNEFWTYYTLPNGWYISLSHHNEKSAGVKESLFYWSDEYIEFQYLHQLQNLYFALTGYELETKELQTSNK